MNGAVVVVRCIRMNAARIVLVARLGEPCIQIEEVGNWWGAGGLIGFGVFVAIAKGFTRGRSIMADRLAAVGVLYDYSQYQSHSRQSEMM